MARRRQNGWYAHNSRVAAEGRPDPGAELRAAHVAYYRARRHPDGLPLWWSDVLQIWRPLPTEFIADTQQTT